VAEQPGQDQRLPAKRLVAVPLPLLDQRIPRREHEPLGNCAIHWHRLDPAWLRTAATWWVKTELEGNRITLTTASGRLESLLPFGDFVTARQLLPAQLVEDHQLLRPLMLDFLHDVIATPSRRPGSRNGLLSGSRVTQIASVARGFYAFMHDHRDDACTALQDKHWAQLSAEHLRFWRMGDLPRSRVTAFDERHLISDEALSTLSAALPLMGRPAAEGGVGDPQAMRILHLLISTGRRVSEICLMSTDPLIPVPLDHAADAVPPGGAGGAGADSGAIAKLRYTQTKIEGAPDTIFVGADVISVIEEQQQWRREHAAAAGHPAPVNGYLFVKYQNNHRGDRPYTAGLLRTQLRKLIERADLRDSSGALLDLSSTHRFRHTKATSLINAGVPLHVVQRYLGHSSPEMTMHYAQTLDTTAKAEFLRYQKLTATGQPATVAADDLYDLMALDARTDRVLPNGWCTLPPAQTCGKGNACLTCDLFVTDRRLPRRPSPGARRTRAAHRPPPGRTPSAHRIAHEREPRLVEPSPP